MNCQNCLPINWKKKSYILTTLNLKQHLISVLTYVFYYLHTHRYQNIYRSMFKKKKSCLLCLCHLGMFFNVCIRFQASKQRELDTSDSATAAPMTVPVLDYTFQACPFDLKMSLNVCRESNRTGEPKPGNLLLLHRSLFQSMTWGHIKSCRPAPQGFPILHPKGFLSCLHWVLSAPNLPLCPQCLELVRPGHFTLGYPDPSAGLPFPSSCQPTRAHAHRCIPHVSTRAHRCIPRVSTHVTRLPMQGFWKPSGHLPASLRFSWTSRDRAQCTVGRGTSGVHRNLTAELRCGSAILALGRRPGEGRPVPTESPA